MPHLHVALPRPDTDKIDSAGEARFVRYGRGIPDYLLQTYWWAYLSPAGVWLFDHQPIINAILFGQYRALLRACLEILEPETAGEMLQVAAVYGILTPTLARRLPPGSLHVVDVAPIQLAAVRRKLEANGGSAHLYRANAESLPYGNGSFETVLLFFLLHELPAAARARVLREAMRVLRPGGALLVADYGEMARPHPFHLLPPIRRTIERLEPFLADFWRQDLDRLVADACPRRQAMRLEACREIFGGFYRLRRYRLGDAGAASRIALPEDPPDRSPVPRSARRQG